MNAYQEQQQEVSSYWMNIINGNTPEAQNEKTEEVETYEGLTEDNPVQSELDGAPAIVALVTL